MARVSAARNGKYTHRGGLNNLHSFDFSKVHQTEKYQFLDFSPENKQLYNIIELLHPACWDTVRRVRKAA